MAFPTDHREPCVDEDGLLRFRTGAGPRRKDVVERNFGIAATLTEGGRLPWVVDARAMTGADPEAWVTIARNLTSIATSLAIVVSDVTPTIMSAWQETFDTLLLPCRVFNDEDSAIAWSKTRRT